MRIDRVNEQLLSELANIINSNVYLDGGLITLTKVKCSPDLRNARVNVSVLPENLSGTALKKLRAHGNGFKKILTGKLNLRTVPKFNFVIDNQERYAADMDKVFDELQGVENKKNQKNLLVG